MELRHLRYFVAVATTENFSQAAVKLNVVQSAVSRQVRDLEIELGCDLFDRIGKRVKLSAFGAQFLPQANRILADVEQARSHAMMVARGQVGILRIALQSSAFDRPIVLRSIKQFKSENPDVELVLKPMRSEEVIEAVLAGSVDGGFIHDAMSYPELRTELLGPEEWQLAMPKGHHLANRPEIYLKDLTNEPFIWLPREVAPEQHDRMLAACYTGGLVPNIVQRASDRLLLLGLIEVGIGLCFLPGPIGGERSTEILLRKVQDLSVPAYPCFVWKSATISPVRQRFLEMIQLVKSEAPIAEA